MAIITKNKVMITVIIMIIIKSSYSLEGESKIYAFRRIQYAVYYNAKCESNDND
jgi:hypothetical protein